MLDGGVNKFLYLGKGDNFVELPLKLPLLHAQNGAVHENVLPPGQLGMKASSNLQQGFHSPPNFGIASCGLGDTTEDLQESCFAGTV